MEQIPEKLIKKKVSEILQKRQRDGVLGTRASAEEEAKKYLQSFWSRRTCSIRLFMRNAASTTFWKWTGIGEKKGWDFLQLAITASIPVIIFLGTLYFNKQQQEIATDRYQQEALTKYFEQMSQLLLDKNLRNEGSEARTIARSRTLSTLRELDSFRKGLLIRFLVEAKLVSGGKSVISLVNADFSGANLSGANIELGSFSKFGSSKGYLGKLNSNEVNLSGANLIGVNLSGANLSGVDLSGADLSGANLIGVDLSGADLYKANLNEALISQADLSGADLRGSNLYHVYLIKADLSYAKLNGANLSGAKLNGANLDSTDLSDANLDSTDLSDTELSYVDFSRASKKLTPEQVTSACNWQMAKFDEDFRKKLEKEPNQEGYFCD